MLIHTTVFDNGQFKQLDFALAHSKEPIVIKSHITWNVFYLSADKKIMIKQS